MAQQVKKPVAKTARLSSRILLVEEKNQLPPQESYGKKKKTN